MRMDPQGKVCCQRGLGKSPIDEVVVVAVEVTGSWGRAESAEESDRKGFLVLLSSWRYKWG